MVRDTRAMKPRVTATVVGFALLLAACGGSDDPQAESVTSTEPSGTVVPIPTDADVDATTPGPGTTPEPAATASDGDTATGDTGQAATPSADPTPAGADVGGWPNRFCVDPDAVETTLNLRAEPSTDSAVLESIPRSSCGLVMDGIEVQDGFRSVLYTTTEGTTAGWVSTDFVVLQDPPDRIEAAALIFVDAWRLGLDTAPYSYGIDTLPAPVTAGRPVLVAGPEDSGCVLVGDVTVECMLVMVEDDGTEVARLSVGGSQRGANGYDGAPYFDDDFPGGPTITSLTVLDS